MSIALFLSAVSGFSGMDEADRRELAENLQERTFADRELLIRRGDPGDSMFVIRSGEVQVPVFDATGRVRTIAQLGPGDVVGEMALLTGERRRADVIAQGVVQAIEMRREVILPLLKEHPTLARFLTEILGQRLEAAGGIEQVGKYRLLGKLGEGATAKVYEALHPGLNRGVAVKMLGHHLVYDQTFRERFLHEAQTIAALNHPNIVQIYDTEQAYATWFLVMEKVEGRDLRAELKERGRIPPEEAASILRQLSDALAHAHRVGVVHRDVKPENAAVDDHGTVKLMDFGIARRTRGEDGRAGMVEGTPAYLAPEAVTGRPTDGRADVYALGIMAFEMLTGRHPFPATSLKGLLEAHVRQPVPDPKQFAPDLPEPLLEFIRGALVKDPEGRLSEWSHIRSLLSADGSGVTAPLEERIIRLRYRREDRARVEKAAAVLARQVGGLPQADVASAVLGGPSAEDRGAGPTTTTGSSWFARIAGKGREDGGDTNSTRSFKD